jgi:lipoprotein-anchoring transpeptidase ErfK/SrfK
MTSRIRLFLAGTTFLLVLAPPMSAAPQTALKKPANDPVTAAAANEAAGQPTLLSSSKRSAAVLRAQILLDRAHFSPGEIDGFFGGTMRGATVAFNLSGKIKAGASVSAATWEALNLDTAPVIVPYALTAEDLAGPFAPIPEEMAGKAKLPALGYANLAEALGEKFHASPALLAVLNPGETFDRPGTVIAGTVVAGTVMAGTVMAGTVINVPNVARTLLANTAGMTVRVSRSDRAVEAVDANGTVVARYPATTGSSHDPLPLGDWKINGVAWNPPFHYDPDLFWDAEAGEKSVKLAPGPNSPVGSVWIDLSKPHYGIHGTPVPSTIGKTASHGCIRLTNWDAIELAKMVAPGMFAVLGK